MQQRAVRIRVVGTTVKLGDRSGELVNLSLDGALMRLRGDVAVGQQCRLVLTNGTDVVDVSARVLRCASASQDGSLGAADSMVAVQFVDVPEASRKTIPRLLGAEGRGRQRSAR